MLLGRAAQDQGACAVPAARAETVLPGHALWPLAVAPKPGPHMEHPVTVRRGSGQQNVLQATEGSEASDWSLAASFRHSQLPLGTKAKCRGAT